MSDIRILDKEIYELIAAGEVIERPSSVVKELVENSVDAGASSVSVEIKNGGRTLIRVTDNGCGILPEDIATAFERHATSKIRSKEDLDSISTLGFRGEALASICAVSKIDLRSKRREFDYGIRFCYENGECTCYEECGCPNGTSIDVKDLFFNVPARLKFLKKDVSEGNAIENMVSKIALSHPEISFKLIRDGRTAISTPGDGKLLSAIYAVLGREFSSTLIPVDYELSGVGVHGFITKPLGAKANRSYQNFFVNNRYVKSVTCMVALEEAYRNQIMIGKFPGCVLAITVSPASTDVNVHPTKLEIRFSDEKPIYDAIYFAVKNALMLMDSPDSAGLIKEPEPKKHVLTHDEIFRKPEPEAPQMRFGSSSPAAVSPLLKDPGTVARVKMSTPPGAYTSPKDPYRIIEFTEKNKEPEPPKEAPIPVEETVTDEPEEAAVRVIGEAFKTYIICERGDCLYLIDKHAAHERLNFERLKSNTATVDCQSLLNPIKVTLSYDGYTAVCGNTEALERFGFKVSPLEAPDISLSGIPILLTDEDPADLLTVAADDLASSKVTGPEEIFDNLFHSIACKASIKANSRSDISELEYLARAAFKNDVRYCPHGRPALVRLTKYELEKLFKRVQ